MEIQVWMAAAVIGILLMIVVKVGFLDSFIRASIPSTAKSQIKARALLLTIFLCICVMGISVFVHEVSKMVGG